MSEFTEDSKQLLKLVQAFFESAYTFEASTKFSTVKAGEVYVAIIVNQWLAKNNFEGQIKLTRAHKGFDGILVYNKVSEKPIGVEIKTCKESKEFRFSREFEFNTHGLIILAEIEKGKPAKIFVAHGTRAMKVLQGDLDADKERNKYRVGKNDMPRLFSSARKTSVAREKPSIGIEGMVDIVWDSENWIHDLNETVIEDLLNSLNN